MGGPGLQASFCISIGFVYFVKQELAMAAASDVEVMSQASFSEACSEASVSMAQVTDAPSVSAGASSVGFSGVLSDAEISEVGNAMGLVTDTPSVSASVSSVGRAADRSDAGSIDEHDRVSRMTLDARLQGVFDNSP